MSKMYKLEKAVFCYFVEKLHSMKKIHVIPALVIFMIGINQAFGQLKTNEVGQRTFSFEDKSRSRKLID